MKKLLLLSALMLTANMAAAENCKDPCDDWKGTWFGEGTSTKGVTIATAQLHYNSQLVYLDIQDYTTKTAPNTIFKRF